MPKTYKIEAETAEEIKEIRKGIKDKVVDKRLHAVQLRGEGMKNKEIAKKLDTSDKVVSHWISTYANKGIAGLLGRLLGGVCISSYIVDEDNKKLFD